MTDASESFDAGVQVGARVEHRVAVEATANALLAVLGKDAGDGIIDLGAAGQWLSKDGRWHALRGSASSTWDPDPKGVTL